MRVLYAAGLAGFACVAALGLFFGFRAGTPEADAAAPVPASFVAHEWGTFTSFGGSDGVHVGFRPNNEDLPSFVYHLQDQFSKGGFLRLAGLVSMETPVIYFYADKPVKATVDVKFPRGWITEWYPVAATEPSYKNRNPGQSIRWKVQVMPGESFGLPRDDKEANPYYHARATDAAPVQAEDPRVGGHSGGVVVQREKFLFYRGVGTFAPPVTVKALGGGEVKVVNTHASPVGGLVLLTARNGGVAFQKLDDVPAKGELVAKLPTDLVPTAELGALLVKQLTATGLYEAEAKAMVKTWESAWFGETGHRLLYLVPTGLTDELLPLTIDPKPTEVVRVLVGRHDFVTPEQEAEVLKQHKRALAAQAELNAAQEELNKVGRFAEEARARAAAKLEQTGKK